MNLLFPSIYEELDMSRYAQLASDLLSDNSVKIVLCDDSGQVIWTSDNKFNSAKLIVTCARKNLQKFSYEDCSCVEQTDNNAALIRYSLGSLAGSSAGDLLFYDFDQLADNNIELSKLAERLSIIAEIIKTDLGRLYEVNAMAGELGERYDELSMLRAADLSLDEHRDSRHILSTYIRSCADHLNVDYAAIWIPSRQQLFPGGVAYENVCKEILSLLQDLSQAAFVLFENGYEGFGINNKNKNKDKELRKIIGLPENKKVLMIPVLDSLEKPCGVLICLNEIENDDFDNSDKATLEAVSRKTYKYIIGTQDELTGLLNRKGFDESVWREVLQPADNRHLVLFNINQFKVINAAYGATTGDLVLKSLATVISKSEHTLKYVSRLDADQFAALVITPGDEVEAVVRKICHDIDSMSIDVAGKNLRIKCSAGVIALNSKETALVDHLYAAEMALAGAKEKSNSVVVYKPGNTALLKRKHQLTQVENIKHALKEDRFVLYCQRIQPLVGSEVHYEILVRMIDESGQLVAPDDFIPVAENFDLMSQVDRWIIQHTFEILTSEMFCEISANYKWGINLSGKTIGDEGFHDFVSDCLKKYNFPPTNLYFEITETTAIKNFKNCLSFMSKINSLGVQFALDDFGSGLSSFSYLKKLSIDYLKIDGSLVKDIVSSKLDQTMVSSIADIAHVLNVKTIAEYVENDEILEVLNGLEIDYAQGYGIMKPQAVESELKNLLEHFQYKASSAN